MTQTKNERLLIIVLSSNSTEYNSLNESGKKEFDSIINIVKEISNGKNILILKNENHKYAQGHLGNSRDIILLYHTANSEDLTQFANCLFKDCYGTATSDEYLNKVILLLKCLCDDFNCENSEKELKYNDIWDYCVNRNTQMSASALRAEILTPLIPFHFYLQIPNPNAGWETILNESFEAIEQNNKDGKMEKFLALLKDASLKKETEKHCYSVQGFIDKGMQYLIEEVKEESKSKEYEKIIKNFADSLEKAVSFIEAGEAVK